MPRPAPLNMSVSGKEGVEEPTTPTIRVSRPSSTLAPPRHQTQPLHQDHDMYLSANGFPIPSSKGFTPSSPIKRNRVAPLANQSLCTDMTNQINHPNALDDVSSSRSEFRRQTTVLSNSIDDTHPVASPKSLKNKLLPSDTVQVLKQGTDNPVFTLGDEELQRLRNRPRNASEGNLTTTTRGGILLPPLRIENHNSPLTPFLTPKEMDCLTVPESLALGTRRQSWASVTSRDSLFSTSRWRLRPILNPSISDTISDPRTPLHSPHYHSASPNDAFFPPDHLKDEDNLSILSATNSLSNVSSNLSERFLELYRAFSSRTQRFKEKTTQPPTPSSTSSYDGMSALSVGGEDTPHQRRRLDSYIPSAPQSEGTSGSDPDGDLWVEVGGCQMKIPQFCRRLKFPSTLDPQEKLYLFWLFLVTLTFMYNVWCIPLRGVFPYQTPENLKYWLAADYVCDFIYFIDIVIFKMRIRFINNGILETDRQLTRKHYMTKWMFKLDVLSLLPLDFFYFLVGFNPWLRLPRFFKIQTFLEFYERCDQAAKSGHVIRVVKTMTYMLYLIHIETCGYYAVSVYQGINSNRWVYNGQGIAYIRCFYLATKTATSIGNNPIPTNMLEYGFMILYWLSGVFVFALLIGQIRDIFEAAGHLKSNFRKKMDITMWYMKSINLPESIQDRVRLWFNYNWEQQKTLNENSLLDSLPLKLQTDLAINVHYATLSKVQLFQDCDKNLLYDLVLKLKPVLCLPGDYICKKGEVGKEMYIVSKGQVEVVAGAHGEIVLATLYEGSVFGEISLLALSGCNRRTADVRCKGFTNLFILNKVDFEGAMRDYPDAQKLLKKRAKKLLSENAAKMEKKSQKMSVEEIIHSPRGTPKMVKTVIQVMNPEASVIKKIGSFKASSTNMEVNREAAVKVEKVEKDRENRRRQGDGKDSDTASQFSLSDIPDENGGESLSEEEEEEVLIVEKYEHELKEGEVVDSGNQGSTATADYSSHSNDTKFKKRPNLEDMGDSKGSVDSGVQSSKTGSASQSTKSMSNRNSKESLNSEIIDSGPQIVKDEDTVHQRSGERSKDGSRILSPLGGSYRAPSGQSIRSSRSIRSTGSVQDLASARRVKFIANGGTKQFQRGMYAPSSPELNNIPPENQVTCAVEIHREKSVTPLSMLGDDMLIGRIGSLASVNSKTDETAC